MHLGDHWWLYVGHFMPFMGMRMTFQVPVVDNVPTWQYQYFSASAGWKDFSGLVDGTLVGGYPWHQNGIITWDRPTDWILNTPTSASGEWYWWRFRPDILAQSSGMDGFDIAEIEVYADIPTTDGLNMIMAYAPSGWKTSGYAATATEAYGQINDMSVLAALRWLRDQIGGHFRASMVGGVMQIDWMNTFYNSGYTADGAAVP
jgi:hypothetical protein